jgi:hypothetical protein
MVCSSVSSVPSSSDRHLNLKGINFDAQSSHMMERITLHALGGEDPFWVYFFQYRTRPPACATTRWGWSGWINWRMTTFDAVTLHRLKRSRQGRLSSVRMP